MPALRPAWTWLTARPIAHRGLHAADRGVIENTVAAAHAAVAAGYAIECDVRRTRDGEAAIFHDATLERLAPSADAVAALTLEELTRLPLRQSPTSRIPSFVQLLQAVAGRVPVICEIKSVFDGDMRLAERVADVAATYHAPLALKSFDPAIIEHLRRNMGARCPLGIVAQARFEGAEWNPLSLEARHGLANFLHSETSRPDFLSFRAADLPHAVPHLCRAGLGLPIMSWTVRSADAQVAARAYCDQIVFEGFRPATAR